MNINAGGSNAEKVEQRKRTADYTINQFGATTTVLVIIVWSLASMELHLASSGCVGDW